MQDLRQEAERIGVLFHYGVIRAEDVILWADTYIATLKTPPDLLLELSSTRPSQTADILSALRRLSDGACYWRAVRSALPAIRDYVALHDDNAESIAHHLYVTAYRIDLGEVPKDLRFIYGFDDAFALARQGTYGDRQTISQAFREALNIAILRQGEEP